MKAKVTCRVTAKDTHTFYVSVNGKDYFLFNQEYRRTVEDYFRHGVTINQINDYSKVSSHVVKRTLDKLPSYIHYVEKEYGVVIYEKTNKREKRKKNKLYKRKAFKWQNFMWEVA